MIHSGTYQDIRDWGNLFRLVQCYIPGHKPRKTLKITHFKKNSHLALFDLTFDTHLSKKLTKLPF